MWHHKGLITGNSFAFILALFSVVLGATRALENSLLEDHSVNIKMLSNWQTPPFALQLLETAAAQNESLYTEVAAKVLRLSVSLDPDTEDDFDAAEDLGEDTYTDKDYYRLVSSLLEDKEEQGYFDIYLANNYYAPRVTAHFDYYNSTVLPLFQDKLSKCSSSFDAPGKKDNSVPTTWMLYNGEVLCNPNDIFALKTTSGVVNTNDQLLPFDRVIGFNDAAPLVVLYGKYDDPLCREFVFHLFQSAKVGKIRFAWRYIGPTEPISGDEESKQLLSGYGVDLTLKRTDYIVIDDRDIKKADKPIKNLDGKENEQVVQNQDEEAPKEETTGLGFFNKTYRNIQGLSKKQLKNLDLKVANYIINKAEGDNFSKLELLKDIIINFPKYAYDIATSKTFKFSKKDLKFQTYLEKIKENNKYGADGELKGLFVNGKKLSDLKYNIFEFLKLIKSEKGYIDRLLRLNVSPITSKGFITEFAKASAVQSVKSSTAGNRKRYNIYNAVKSNDIKGEKIVYLNDLERDPEYQSFSKNKNLWHNLQQAAMGRFPQYKENVLEVVFAINLSNRRLLQIFTQVAQTVLSRGIAHRIGIIPITLDESDPYYNYVTGESLTVNGKEKVLSVKEMQILDKLLLIDFYEKAKSAKANKFSILSYLEELDDEIYSKLWEKYLENPDILSKHDNSEFVKNFSIDEGFVIVNGVFQPFNVFNGQWQSFIAQQFFFDIQFISQSLSAGKILKKGKIADYLYQGLPPLRNTLIVPQDTSEIEYKHISIEYLQNLISSDHSVAFVNEITEEQEKEIYQYYSFSLIGDFSSQGVKKQLIEILNNEKRSLTEGSREHLTKYRLVNTGKDNTLIEKIVETLAVDGKTKVASFKLGLMENLNKLIDAVNEYDAPNKKSDDSYEPILNSLQKIDIKLRGGPIILINSRVLAIPDNKWLESGLVNYLFSYEKQERLFGFLFKVIDEFEAEHHFIEPLGVDRYDWCDLFFSILTKTYYESGNNFELEVSRYDLSLLDFDQTSLLVTDQPEKTKNGSAVEVVAVIDPIEETSQKLISMLDVLQRLTKSTNAVHLTVLLAPTINMKELGIKRLYKGLYVPQVAFDKSTGNIDKSIYNVKFDRVPEETLFTLDLDVPHSWIALAKRSKYDLDNIKLDLTEEKYIDGVYELENIIIEGYSDTVGSPMPPNGIQLELKAAGSNSVADSNSNAVDDRPVFDDTSIMANYGYFQLKSNPGVWELAIKPFSKSAEVYSMVKTKSDLFNNDAVTFKDKSSVLVSLLNLDGVALYQNFVKNPGKEQVSLIKGDNDDDDDDDSENAAQSGNLKDKLFSLWGSKDNKKSEAIKKKQADINIFAVASGHLYERLLSIMTASVRNHTEHSLKFWLIDNYMSANFKEFLPTLAAKYNFEYELITYKWPLWLRSQREKQRTIWGYKILFLDVLFPQDLDKVIFVDADQIVRTDLKELVDLDLHGAPYGYTPMCDSRTEMEGFRFWKQGYWKNILSKINKPYHISALYVVDLKKFRSIAAGDRLRQHYQQLSADPNSLSNLDQDLPNNLQYQIKIHSLDQDWLWCETWCSDESLKTAKTIDLCNNPLTKEPKLDRARRQIPEWTAYDNEIGALMEEVKQTSLNGEKLVDKEDQGVKEQETSEEANAEDESLLNDTVDGEDSVEALENQDDFDPLHDEL